MRESKQIVDRVSDMFAAGWTYPPAALRDAAKRIRSLSFTAEPEERELASSIASWLEMRADHKERMLRETYGQS